MYLTWNPLSHSGPSPDKKVRASYVRLSRLRSKTPKHRLPEDTHVPLEEGENVYAEDLEDGNASVYDNLRWIRKKLVDFERWFSTLLCWQLVNLHW